MHVGAHVNYHSDLIRLNYCSRHIYAASTVSVSWPTRSLTWWKCSSAVASPGGVLVRKHGVHVHGMTRKTQTFILKWICSENGKMCRVHWQSTTVNWSCTSIETASRCTCARSKRGGGGRAPVPHTAGDSSDHRWNLKRTKHLCTKLEHSISSSVTATLLLYIHVQQSRKRCDRQWPICAVYKLSGCTLNDHTITCFTLNCCYGTLMWSSSSDQRPLA